MKLKIVIVMCLFLLSLVCSGCVPLLVGAAGVGGYAISRDTIQTETDKDYDSLWASALSVVKARGEISVEDTAEGYLEANIGSSRLIVELTKLTKTTSRLKVSARNQFKLPDVDLAQEIFVKIFEETPE